MDTLARVFAPLCASLLLAFVFVLYAVCRAGGCNDAHIDRHVSEKFSKKGGLK